MKTKSDFTPGPWQCDGIKRVSDRTPDHFAVLGPNGIEAIADCFYGRTDNERAANARLIAAAPALLEALQRLFNCVPLSVEGPHDDAKIVTSVKYWRTAYDQARAAIAAATEEGQ